MSYSNYQIVKYICDDIRGIGDADKFIDMIGSDDVRWGGVIEQSQMHKLLPAMFLTLQKYKLLNSVPSKIRTLLYDNYRFFVHKNRMLQSEAIRVSQALENADVDYAARKGIVFDGSIYGNEGTRIYNDIDFLINRSDENTVYDVMFSLGYEVGLYDYEADDLIPMPRDELIRYRMSPDHVPRFTKKTDSDIVTFIEVDFATSLTWVNSGYEISTENALADTTQASLNDREGKIRALNKCYLFVDTAMHLFREAYLESSIIDKGEDVNLVKFLDVALLYVNFDASEHSSIEDIVRQYEIERPIGWVLKHMDTLFSTNSAIELSLDEGLDSTWLNSWRESTGVVKQWKGSMDNRLASQDRESLLER